MQYTTQEYRDEMRLPLRGKSYIYAYLGLINSDAQQNASITSSFSGDESQLYDNISSAYQGVTSTEADGSITFTFGDYYELNIAGLTMVFTTIPSSITVTNGEKTETFVVDNAEYSFDDGFTNCHYIKITPSSGKLALKSILFGIGLQFTNRQIMSSTRENSVSHISSDLPKKSFTLVVDNRNHMFNKDNPYGYAKFIQEQQEVKYDYARDLVSGSLYRIKGGTVLIKNWSSDDYQAKFTCVGRIDYLEGTYKKGRFYENGISAYDLAELVFADAGFTHYKLDDSMKRVQIFNPLPIVEYREALKMIANASRCTLYEDRDGDICISNANRPSFIYDAEFVGATGYSIPSALFDDNSLYNYADSEYQYAHADGTLIFLPENESYRQVGFVSSQIANENGLFTNNPSIHVTFKSEFELKKMRLNFAVVVPTSVTVTCKHKGVTVDTQTLSNMTLTTEYVYEGTIDEFTIAFNGASPNQRIHLNNISLDGSIDYELTYHELKETPVASSLEKVSNVVVHAYVYNVEKTGEGSNHTTRLETETVINEDGGESLTVVSKESEYGSAISTISATTGDNLITFQEPYYNYKVTNGTIIESGAYYIVVRSEEEQEIDIYAQPYTITDNITTLKVHEKGVEKTCENPLIGSPTMARQHAEWLRDYYDDDLEYTLTYRGDPILDADDLIYLENHFVANNEIRITDESINTSAGMDFSCKLTARRTSYQVDASTEKAIVGRAKVGEIL